MTGAGAAGSWRGDDGAPDGRSMNHRDVVIVGPGRVGTALALALTRAGLRIVGVGGGSAASRQRFADLVAGVRADADPAGVVPRAGTVVLATPDDVLDQVVTDLAVAHAFAEDQHVVHVAGSRGLGVLERAALAGARVAACHPAQTVPAGAPDPDVFVGSAWAVTCRSVDRAWAHDLVTAVGGDPHDVPDDRRVLYHAALTVGSNTVGAAVAVARQLLLAARVDDPRAFLDPLIAASVANVLADGASALTGPVVRGDVGTVRAHLQALDADLPALGTAYRELSRVLLGQVGPTLPADVRMVMGDLLREPDVDSPTDTGA
jgi:predicted short-subunit dehydrogenase-like oxidoreductase (DUF2520 family)